MSRFRWCDPDEVAELPCTPQDDAAFDRRLQIVGVVLLFAFAAALVVRTFTMDDARAEVDVPAASGGGR